MPALPPAFLAAPLAHRGYHARRLSRPENSRAACIAAMAKGYGIEIDLQLSRDGEAMVFHDYDLGRLTGMSGAVRQHSATELAEIPLAHGKETIPRLSEILETVGGQVPLLIELKDQDGAMGPDVGALEEAAAAALRGYDGPVALMSFNPHSVARCAELAPEIPRGLTTSAFRQADWPMLPAPVRDRLAGIPDLERTGACFISHDRLDLTSDRVREIRAAGLPVLCWTVRSPEEEAEARRGADNITFEGYPA
ncbi:phosphodiesterase [Roseivivax sp. GX 12232]|uniref:glycerophosphodiester phosphodiesterase family protein n=1 Tax=Roseivivax sp. GX 12232 TaxID=2900547 RepID=UPI001E656C41|nr:glycerophosphodiester phosphodiesterase family protein [Roseivivax sp. GX 12232]MCE0505518.1 phosphodiesterase [Roseivivax sp. GX 12232]